MWWSCIVAVVVESGETEVIFSRPAEPYTRALLAAELQIPQPDDERVAMVTG